MDKKEVLKMLKEEIKWHNEHTAEDQMVSPQYRQGFIKGLRQAFFLISQTTEK